MTKTKQSRQWSAGDDATIREHGPKISLRRLAVRLKRPEGSVITRARALGVTVKKTNVMRAEARAVLDSDA